MPLQWKPMVAIDSNGNRTEYVSILQVSGRQNSSAHAMFWAEISAASCWTGAVFMLALVKHGGNVAVWTAESSWQLDDTKRAVQWLGSIMSFCQSKSHWAQEGSDPSDILLYVRNRTKTDTVLKSTGNRWRRVSHCRDVMYFWLKRARTSQDWTEFESVDGWGHTDTPNCH